MSLGALYSSSQRLRPPWLRTKIMSLGQISAKYLADICPSGMIFVRSQGGLSHCEAEYSTPEDIEAGVNVLLHAALTLGCPA